jgi:hypothetical protein
MKCHAFHLIIVGIFGNIMAVMIIRLKYHAK